MPIARFATLTVAVIVASSMFHSAAAGPPFGLSVVLFPPPLAVGEVGLLVVEAPPPPCAPFLLPGGGSGAPFVVNDPVIVGFAHRAIGGGAVAGSPSGAPASCQAATVASSSSVRRWSSFHGWTGLHSSVSSAPHGGIRRAAVSETMSPATALASGREIVVSRGELIEIGDGFRLPDLLESTGARIREVGTTNRTTAADYAAAIAKMPGSPPETRATWRPSPAKPKA